MSVKRMNVFIVAFLYLFTVNSVFGADKPMISMGIVALDSHQIVSLESEIGNGFQVGSVTVYRTFPDLFMSDPDMVTFALERKVPLLVAWQPGQNDEKDCLTRILNGDYDKYIRQFAKDIKAYKNSVFLSFAPEMNGDWNCYGQQPTEFVSAYQYIYKIFGQENVTNVKRILQVNVLYGEQQDLTVYDPGSDLVDAVGIDGYNWGSPWISFSNVFSKTVGAVNTLYPNKPILINETATIPADSTNHSTKANWIEAMFASLSELIPSTGAWHNVLSVTWFDFNKEADWRIKTEDKVETDANVSAFNRGLMQFQVVSLAVSMESFPKVLSETKLTTWDDNRDSVHISWNGETIQFSEVPADQTKNAQIMSGKRGVYMTVTPDSHYSLSFNSSTDTDGKGSCGVYINYSKKSAAGRWGVLLGPVRNVRQTYQITLDDGVVGIKVQFYCKPGSTLNPKITNIQLTQT